jgi:hypothetical protein
MALFQTPEQRQAVKELEFTKNDWRDEAVSGEGSCPHPRSSAPRG